MKSIEEYTAEVLRRAEEKKTKIKARRRRALELTSAFALVLFVGAFTILPMFRDVKDGSSSELEAATPQHGAQTGAKPENCEVFAMLSGIGGTVKVVGKDKVREVTALIDSVKTEESDEDTEEHGVTDAVDGSSYIVRIVSGSGEVIEYELTDTCVTELSSGKTYPIERETLEAILSAFGIEDTDTN
ncbi:MAG: hypothetical protein J5772_06835 [Clostridia bacterium]|nr:hypothetical protein [Clostridia bacterium]